MKKQRKHYTAEEKVAILRRHLLEQEPVSKLCDELGLQRPRTPDAGATARSPAIIDTEPSRWSGSDSLLGGPFSRRTWLAHRVFASPDFSRGWRWRGGHLEIEKGDPKRGGESARPSIAVRGLSGLEVLAERVGSGQPHRARPPCRWSR